MSVAVVFTTLDLTKGYHQMKLAETSKEITAFTSPQGLYQWKVLSMGIKTSGAVFQLLMDQMLGNLQLDALWCISMISPFSGQL